jgi:hypothetical protein
VARRGNLDVMANLDAIPQKIFIIPTC